MLAPLLQSSIYQNLFPKFITQTTICMFIAYFRFAMKRLFLLFYWACCCIGLYAQNTDKPNAGDNTVTGAPLTADDIVFRKEFAVGGMVHTNGWGVSLHFVRINNIKTKTVREYSFHDIQHPKENRRPGLSLTGQSSANSYLYGKRNHLFVLNAAWGKTRTIAEKARKSGVEVDFYYTYGVSLGLLKPYYLDIVTDIVDQMPIVEQVRYTDETADLFTNGIIVGSSGLGYGWGEIEFHPGINARAAIQFDWANYNEFVKAIEVGVMVNAFTPSINNMVKGNFSGIYLMANEDQSYYFANLYLRLKLGKRK